MNIAFSEYRLAELKDQHVQYCADLLAKSFLLHNKVWQALDPPYQQMKDFMRAKIKECLAWQKEIKRKGVIDETTYLNIVYLDKQDEIIGIYIAYQLVQYRSQESPINFSSFEILDKDRMKMEQFISEYDMIPGRCIFGLFGAVSESHLKKGLFSFMMADYYFHLYSKGFRYSYGRSSNATTEKGALMIGGTVLAETVVAIKSKQFRLSFIKNTLNMFPYTDLIRQVNQMIPKL